MGLVNFTFDSVQVTYYVPVEEDVTIPSVVRHTLAGTKHRHIANYVEDDYVQIEGFMSSTNYASMRTKAEAFTVGNLVTTFGTVSAQIVRCTRGDRPGYKSGIDHFVDARLTFLKLGAWS